MNSRTIRVNLHWLLLAGGLFLPAQRLGADPVAERTQRIPLVRGWNAVFLEVYPSEAEPDALFRGTPITVAASHYARPARAQFVTNPGADLFRQAGWGVWYAEGRPDAFLSTLHAIHGQQAYLLQATRDFLWEVTGAVVVPDVQWTPGAFNLVGFSVDGQSPPTFAQFFEGSAAHRNSRIYRLADGAWRRVSSPAAEQMRSGEAFWIYCDGASDYRGPLAVETLTRQGVLVGGAAVAVTLRNRASFPVTPTFEHVPGRGPPVPLSVVVRALDPSQGRISAVSAPRPDGAWTMTFPAIEAGQALQVPFEARLEAMTAPAQASVLRVRSDVGTEVWLPVLATRLDLEESR